MWLGFLAYVVVGGLAAERAGAARRPRRAATVRRSHRRCERLQPAGGLEVEVEVGDVGGEGLGRGVDDRDAVARQRGATRRQLGERLLGGGGGVQVAGRAAARPRSASRAGSCTAATTPCAWRPAVGSTGSSPSPSAPGSRVVNSTTRARLRSSRSTSATTRPKSVSTSAGCSVASAS